MKRLISTLVLCVACLASAAVVDAASSLPGFRSPSRNISCLFIPAAGNSGYSRSPATLLCNLVRAAYGAKLQNQCMSGGGVDWHGFTLTATGRGRVNCSGGILYNPTTQRPSYVTLPYGKSWRRGPFTCASRVTGVSCKNRSGHGLTISRQSWRAW